MCFSFVSSCYFTHQSFAYKDEHVLFLTSLIYLVSTVKHYSDPKVTVLWDTRSLREKRPLRVSTHRDVTIGSMVRDESFR